MRPSSARVASRFNDKEEVSHRLGAKFNPEGPQPKGTAQQRKVAAIQMRQLLRIGLEIEIRKFMDNPNLPELVARHGGYGLHNLGSHIPLLSIPERKEVALEVLRDLPQKDEVWKAVQGAIGKGDMREFIRSVTTQFLAEMTRPPS